MLDNNEFIEYAEVEDIPDDDTGIDADNPNVADDPNPSDGKANVLLDKGIIAELRELGSNVEANIPDEETGID